VTALAPTAVEAEALAKTALLSGPEGALRILAPHGGAAFHEDGRVERIGAPALRARVRLRIPDRRAA
jgi:thiamine biosynthesis lipoprotein ApbE